MIMQFKDYNVLHFILKVFWVLLQVVYLIFKDIKFIMTLEQVQIEKVQLILLTTIILTLHFHFAMQ